METQGLNPGATTLSRAWGTRLPGRGGVGGWDVEGQDQILCRSSARNDLHCGLLRFLDLVTSPARREQFCACSLEENGAITHQFGFWIPEKASSEPADGGGDEKDCRICQGSLSPVLILAFKGNLYRPLLEA